MYDFPARSARTLDPSMSIPTTGIPASAYSIASGSPTYPKPTIAAVKFFRLMRDSRSFSFRMPAMSLATPPPRPPCPRPRVTPYPYRNGTGKTSCRFQLLQLRDQLRHRLEEVGHQPVIRHLEDRRLLVLVDRDDHLAVLHPRQVLDRPADPQRDVQFRSDDLPRLPHLPVVGRPP